MKVVIIGGGTAGISTATHLRRKDENARIVVLEKSDEFAVATCGLPYYLSGAVTELDDLKGATPEQMEKIFKIEVKLKHEVVNINRENKKLIIDGGEEESYDKLVIATGALHSGNTGRQHIYAAQFGICTANQGLLSGHRSQKGFDSGWRRHRG